jgi:hypothetical protein
MLERHHTAYDHYRWWILTNREQIQAHARAITRFVVRQERNRNNDDPRRRIESTVEGHILRARLALRMVFFIKTARNLVRQKAAPQKHLWCLGLTKPKQKPLTVKAHTHLSPTTWRD